MPKIVNTFIKGKLNKDLDARLIPNGEYRDARNVQVSKSEGPDVGELENVLGNKITSLTWSGTTKCIGYVVDESNSYVYIFTTTNTGSAYDSSATNKIYQYNVLDDTYIDLINSGAFLNFSQLNPIYSVNIIEDLLFWTDNRNQPRKININTAVDNNRYYTTEDQISVAKYSPYQPINLYKKSKLNNVVIDTVQLSSANQSYSAGSTIGFTSPSATQVLKVGQTVVCKSDCDNANYTLPPNTIVTSATATSATGYDIQLNNDVDLTGSNGKFIFYGYNLDYETTMKDVTSKFAPTGGSAFVNGAFAGGFTVSIDGLKNNNPIVNQPISYIDTPGGPMISTGAVVLSTSGTNPITSVTAATTLPAMSDNAELIFNPNPYFNNEFAGDPAFLEDKFVRFSYRYRYDDNEYSILAPFTQVAFIPKQDGYFMYVRQENPNIDKDDQASAYRSTIVDFVENKVDDIELVFPLPYEKTNLENALKIKELEIIYKESDALAIQVIDTIPIEDIYNSAARVLVNGAVTAATDIVIDGIQGKVNVGDYVTGKGVNGEPIVTAFNSTTSTITVDIPQDLSNNTYLYIGDPFNYHYSYVSKKPFKTLPSDEITRVSDKIPVKAFSQEVSGNRIIYGNYQNKHTPPAFLDYNVAVSEKSEFEISDGTARVNGTQSFGTAPYNINIDNWSGTANIDVGDYIFNSSGFFLAIVKSVPTPNTIVEFDRVPSTLGFSSSLIDNDVLTFTDPGTVNNRTSKIEYPNHTLKSNRNYQVGVVLSDRYGRQSSVVLSNNKTTATVGTSSFIGDTVYAGYNDASVNNKTWPGDSLKVLFNNPIGPTAPIPQTFWPGLYNSDTTSADYNPLGWYSYKIVVKQTEQEYYNVYLPGVMASYPNDTKLELGSTSHISLINDNINKIPRDLNEVGPEQKQFRSSVRLFGRVENTANTITSTINTWGVVDDNLGQANTQYFPGRTADTVSTIATIPDLFDYDPANPPKPNYFPQFYLFESNPLIGRISTESQIGQIATTNYSPFTAVFNAAVASPGSSQDIVVIFPEAAPADGTINGFLVIAPSVPDNIFVSNYTNEEVSSGQAGTGHIDTVDIDGNSFRITCEQDEAIVFEPAFTGTGGLGVLKNPGIQYLAVYETTPVVSNLDIYWETTTTGLISDLNNFILNESSGGASFTFDANTWTEALASGANILNTPVKIQDQFGVDLDPANYSVIDFTIDQVTDGIGNDVTGYFEQPAGNQTTGWNIATTSDYFDVVFYNNDAESYKRLFNFFFTIRTVENTSGDNVESIVSASAANIGPNNVSPTGSFTSATSGITSTTVQTDRYNTSSLTTLFSRNGSANEALRTLDLTTAITQITKNGVALSNSGDDLFSNYFTITPSVVSNDLNTDLFFANSELQVANYVVTIATTDAAEQVTAQVTINLNQVDAVNGKTVKRLARVAYDPAFGSAPTVCTNGYVEWCGFYNAVEILVDNAADSSQNGYYLFFGSYEALTQGTNNITIDHTGAQSTVTANCSYDGQTFNMDGRFFYSSDTTSAGSTAVRALAVNSDCTQAVEDCELPDEDNPNTDSAWVDCGDTDISSLTVEII
tara:strand:+ start:1954 stop:6690 length:4737 start_codon:yes stop_codon:yes gene_type:complete